MKLTDRQKSALKRHSEHHTKKHMDMMKKDMKAGMSFTAAHKKAQKAVGK
jgi:LAS superfamily LD-carboxypeptidase LdcB